jgi:hypothetical protein
MRAEIPGKQKGFDTGIPILEVIVANTREKNTLDINYSTKIVRKDRLNEADAKRFVNPIDVAFLPNGSMLVADYNTKKIHRIFPLNDASMTIEAPPSIGTYCPIRLRSPWSTNGLP